MRSVEAPAEGFGRLGSKARRPQLVGAFGMNVYRPADAGSRGRGVVPIEDLHAEGPGRARLGRAGQAKRGPGDRQRRAPAGISVRVGVRSRVVPPTELVVGPGRRRPPAFVPRGTGTSALPLPVGVARVRPVAKAADEEVVVAIRKGRPPAVGVEVDGEGVVAAWVGRSRRVVPEVVVDDIRVNVEIARVVGCPDVGVVVVLARPTEPED